MGLEWSMMVWSDVPIVCCSAGNLLVGNNELNGTVPSQLSAKFPVNSTTWSSTCIANVSSPKSGCDLMERPALVDLYASTSGPQWVNNNGWLSLSHPCMWYGVTCSGGSTVSGPVV